MIKLNIEAYASNGDHYEHAEKYVDYCIDIYKELEETLYILYELEPINRFWKREMRMNGTPFSYAGIEASKVKMHRYNDNFYVIEVRDI